VSFILDAERSADVVAAFERYREYLQSVRDSFPASAFELASSEWYFTPSDHRCPHDSWLEEVVLSESSSASRPEQRSTSIRVRLRAAHHDDFIEFHYPQVFRYFLDSSNVSRGHRDWRYDEFRLSDAGRLLHEIEWCGAFDTGRWLIEASDVTFHWIPSHDS